MELRTKSLIVPSRIVKMWQRVVDTVAVSLSVPSVMINRLQPPELEVFRSNTGPENPFPSGTRMEMEGVYCAMAARKRQGLEVGDARKDLAWADSPTARAGIYAYLGYPIFWPDGDVFGTICAVDSQERKWKKQHRDLLRTFRDVMQGHLVLVTAMEQLNEKNAELELALKEVKTLRGLMPICASCKKVRDDRGYWNQIENYIQEHSEAQFTHGICPDCAKRLYPDLDE